MTKYCLKNPRHTHLGPERCLTPGCGSLLGDTGVDDSFVATPEAGGHPPEAAPEGPIETLIEHVEDDVKSLFEGTASDLRAKIDALVGRARGKAHDAQQSADLAAQHAKTAGGIASQAADAARPHADQPGFAEAARHAAGADYHAVAAQAAAEEAAGHAASAARALQAVESLAATAGHQTTADGLHALVTQIEQTVDVIVDCAARAAGAVERAKAAAGETTAIGGFFTEALSLWHALRGV